MLRSVRGLTALAAVAGLAGVAACGSSSPTGPTNVSLAGNYTLTSFTEAGNDLTSVATGTLVLTDSTYNVHLAFQGNVVPPVADSGTYTATSTGSFSETSSVDGSQVTGTYTDANNMLTVNLTTVVGAITQTWQKQ